MSEGEIRIARRIATYMLEAAEQQIDLSFFQGLGMGLAVVFEESTSRSALSLKPQELLEWAKNLPAVPYPHVKES